MDEFCGSPFWDRNVTWDTTDPYFTHCFEETTLAWVPAGFLILFAFADVNYSLSSKRTDRIPWNIYTVLKCLVIVALTAVSVVHIILIQDHNPKSADNLSPGIRIASYVIALLLIVLNKRRGMRTSGVQFIFWFGAFFCECIAVRTAIRKYDKDSDDEKLKAVYLMRFFTFPLVTIQLILQCFADGSWGRNREKDALLGNPCPEKNSSFFSKILYLWYDNMAWKGYRKPLSYDDLWDLNEVDRAKTQVPMFYKYWEAAQRKAKEQSLKTGKTVEASVVSVLIRAYGATFMFGGFMKFVQDSLAFVSPEILKLLVAHVAIIPGQEQEESWKGFLYAGILFAVSLFQTVVGVQYNKRMLLIGMRVRTALSSAIYRKALLVSNVAKKESTVGEIVNLMSVDTQRFMDLTPFIHMLWTAPVQIAIAIYFLYINLGASVFAGLAVMVLLVPANGVVAAKVRQLQMKQMVLKDNRVKLMSELLSGMKVLKLYAWEPSFQQQIQDIRNQEMQLLKKAAYLNSSTIFMFTCAPFLVSLATFGTYVMQSEENNLNAQKAFVSLTLFNIIRMPLTMFPMCIALMVQATVSVNRINKYMNSEEIAPDAVTHDESDSPISISNGTFSWDEPITLKNINLQIKSGSLVAVVGTVGSGKSSLLNAILGDLKKHSGQVNTKGSIAYVAQGAWIQNATLKDNILFNDNFNQQKYKRVIDACSLGPDLQILSAGDKTEIGEKGINLSGGQKQRVALARAAYKESDVYLWDDPLSAVDSHVGKHIFDNLIGPNGILKGKTRVLVTHGVAYLPQVDNIVVMKDGEISEVGTFKELLMKKGAFAEFLITHLGNTDDPEIDESLMEEVKGIVDQDTFRRQSSKILQRLHSKESITKDSIVSPPTEEKINPQEKLIEDEKAETGSIKMSVFVDYLKTAGLQMVIVALAFNIIFQGVSAYSNIWLSDWSDQATEDEKKTNGKQDRDTTNLYLGVYGGLGVVQAVTVLIGTISLALGTLSSAAALHLQMLSRTMKAPMSYFDTTPLGRLVNRFAKDVDTVDNLVPLNIRAFLNIMLSVIAIIIVISYSTPIFLAFIIPCSVLYFFLQRFYVATSRQLKRIESVSRSPIYSQFGETISGATTIRAFTMQEEFVAIAEKKIDYNQQAYYPFVASNMWIAVRLETVGSLIIFAAALFAVIARGDISPSIVGLSVSYALQITSLLNFLVRISTELETNIVAVERMKELTETPQEADWVVNNNRPNKEWPQSGVVVFDKYAARYRDGLDLVLKGITCSINPGEKVGIVGRTGAGKSSLTLALFRLVEPAGGTITIDGQDITQIGLHDLRSKITIIPQDPVLFSGNLRINLDPFNAYSDEQVWKCLELAHLKPFVNSNPQGLLLTVAEEGQNFSVGQRQLVCLARALLRKTKILVLDEATAAVDLETDDLIQKTIREEFKYSTVITIAHRLNTIMDSNRVVVLDQGEIREFDTPDNLLKETTSIFHSMAKDAGIL